MRYCLFLYNSWFSLKLMKSEISIWDLASVSFFNSIRNLQWIRLQFSLILLLSVTKVLVSTGYPTGTRATEVINLQDESTSCNDLPAFPKVFCICIWQLISNFSYHINSVFNDSLIEQQFCNVYRFQPWEIPVTNPLRSKNHKLVSVYIEWSQGIHTLKYSVQIRL